MSSKPPRPGPRPRPYSMSYPRKAPGHAHGCFPLPRNPRPRPLPPPTPKQPRERLLRGSATSRWDFVRPSRALGMQSGRMQRQRRPACRRSEKRPLHIDHEQSESLSHNRRMLFRTSILPRMLSVPPSMPIRSGADDTPPPRSLCSLFLPSTPGGWGSAAVGSSCRCNNERKG